MTSTPPVRLRLGLCCLFRQEPIRFRATTAKALAGLPRGERLRKVSGICRDNCKSLVAALAFLARHGIGAFRITTPFFPRYTHPVVGYTVDELPDAAAIRALLAQAASFREQHDLRLSFHPDQFIVLSSPRASVLELARRELEYQGMLAAALGAEVINLHGGGAYGNKREALSRLRGHFATLSPPVRSRLTLENDDVTFTVRDLLPVCQDLGIPLVYDVHHHRCNPDGLTAGEATRLAAETWSALGREPWFHLSSPRNGWGKGSPKPHADFVAMADLPRCWLALRATVDVEAKAKELAVLRLRDELAAWAGKHPAALSKGGSCEGLPE